MGPYFKRSMAYGIKRKVLMCLGGVKLTFTSYTANLGAKLYLDLSLVVGHGMFWALHNSM